MNDGQLLRRYVRDNDDPAFRELVHRHLDLVHGTATRRLGDLHAAADVSQAVFCLLVRKAPGLFEKTDLGGWLHRATCWKASEYERAERRRRVREMASAAHGEAMTPDSGDALWDEIAPILDVTLDQLNEADRQLILWRFHRRRSLKEIGDELRLSEDAARMRMNRALERLRRLLAPAVGSALGGAASISRGAIPLEEFLAQRLPSPAPSELRNRVIAAASRVRTEPGWVSAEAWRGWTSGWGWRPALVGFGGVLIVVLIVPVFLNGRGLSPAESGDGLTPSGEPADRTKATLPGSSARYLSSRRVADAPVSGIEPSDLEGRMAPLWRILRSEVPDLSYPPNDLRECIASLADQPEAVFDALSRAMSDPMSVIATRERAIWGLWLLGEAAPMMRSQIVPVAVGLIVTGEPRMMRWHASEVLLHLGIPDGSVGAVGNALQGHPDAWAATERFWESAVNRRPEEVREAVTPWLQREDALRFLAATALARLPAADGDQLAPILLDGLRDGERQDAAIRGLKALGRAAQEFAPQLVDRLAEAKQSGQRVLRDRLIEVLAEVQGEGGSPKSGLAWRP